MILACVESSSVQGPVSSPDPVEHAAAIGVSLDEALQLWRASEFSAAQSLVYQAYNVNLAPFGPALSAQDAAAALALEYDFGRLGWKMRRHGRDDEVTAAAAALSADVRAALSLLSAPAEEDAP
jgi:hypothetical protein